MGRRGNPYDNATAESFMKTLKVEAVYPMAFDTFADVAEHLPRFIEETYNRRRLHSGARLSEPAAVRGSTPPVGWQFAARSLSTLRGALHTTVSFTAAANIVNRGPAREIGAEVALWGERAVRDWSQPCDRSPSARYLDYLTLFDASDHATQVLLELAH